MGQIHISAASQFGIALQRDHNLMSATPTWKKFPFTAATFGPNQPSRNLPLESGSDILPRGMYKTGLWGQGPVAFLPRLQDDIGHILLATMGFATVTPNVAFSSTGAEADDAETGSYIHSFKLSTQRNYTPYLSVRRFMEGVTVTGNDAVGEHMQDARIGSLELNLPSMGVLAGTMELMARTPADKDLFVPKVYTAITISFDTLDDSINDSAAGFQRFEPGDSIIITGSVANSGTKTVVSATSSKIVVVENLTTEVAGPTVTLAINWFTDAYDSDDAFAVSADPKSRVTVAGEVMQCTGLTVTMTNSPLPVEQAMIIGEYTPLDFPNVTRQMVARATVLISNYDLYRALIANSTTGKKFSATPYKGDFDFRAYSPLTYLAGLRQHAIQARCLENNVAWALQGTLPFQAGQPIVATLLGTVQRPVSGEYAEVRIQNTVSTAYAVPIT